MARDLAWVSGFDTGRLALMARPRPGDWLAHDIANWAHADISTVVSLLEPAETRELDLSREETLCREHGIDFVSLPIPDRGVPTSRQGLHDLVERLHTTLRAGGTVAIHCRAGIGRTGLLAGCLLFRAGVPFPEIFGRLSRARGVTMPDTPEQVEWVRRFTLAAPPEKFWHGGWPRLD